MRRLHSILSLAASIWLTACASFPGVGMDAGTPDTSSSPIQGAAGEESAGTRAAGVGTSPASGPSSSASGTAAAAGPNGQFPGTGREARTATARTGLDSLNPDGLIDFSQPGARQDLWQRIRTGFAIPELSRTEALRQSEQWYASRPDYVQRMTVRGSRYLFHIVEEVQRRGLPTELALLPFIESAFNPQALSSAKASGMWQFMPATGKDFDLRQTAFRDDRRNVLASTRAALDYLTRLHAQFGHWHLALAAYNWGEGNVQRAILRNQKAGLPTDYENLRMPDETRRYVPKLMAVKNIVAQPGAFGLTLPALENHPYFLSVPVERDIDVDLAARLAGLSTEEFMALNPQHNKPVILAAGTPVMLLPYDNAERFLIEVANHRGMLASWSAWVAPKSLRAAEAAKLTGWDESRLRAVNQIPRGMMIRKGSTLLVPRTARHGDVSEQVAAAASINLMREPVGKAAAGAKPGSKKPSNRTGTKTATASTPARTAQASASVGQRVGNGR